MVRMFERGGGRPSGDELRAKEVDEAARGAPPLVGLRRPKFAGGVDNDEEAAAAATAVSTRSRASRAAVGDSNRGLALGVAVFQPIKNLQCSDVKTCTK